MGIEREMLNSIMALSLREIARAQVQIHLGKWNLNLVLPKQFFNPKAKIATNRILIGRLLNPD